MKWLERSRVNAGTLAQKTMFGKYQCLESLFLGIREMTALFITRKILKLAPSVREVTSLMAQVPLLLAQVEAVQASRHLPSNVTIKLIKFADVLGCQNRVMDDAPETGVTDGYDPPCGCSGMNPGLLEEEQVL